MIQVLHDYDIGRGCGMVNALRPVAQSSSALVIVLLLLVTIEGVHAVSIEFLVGTISFVILFEEVTKHALNL